MHIRIKKYYRKEYDQPETFKKMIKEEHYRIRALKIEIQGSFYSTRRLVKSATVWCERKWIEEHIRLRGKLKRKL